MSYSINSEVHTFADQITQRKLPIERGDALLFGEALKDLKAPVGLLSSLVPIMRFVDKPEMDMTLQKMVDVAVPFVKDEPYFFIADHIPGSGAWIYQRMIDLGLPHAEKVVNVTKDIGATYVGFPTMKHHPEKIMPYRSKLLLADDFSLSSAQIVDNILGHYDDRDYNQLTLLGYMGEAAEERFSETDLPVHCVNADKIKTFFKHLPPVQLDFLEELVINLSGGSDFISNDDGLFWTYYKVPDNTHQFFRGGFNGMPRLIDDQKFIPEYR